MLEDDFFWNIINSGLRSDNRYVSPDIKKMLMKGFMLAISPFYGHDEKRREYLDQVSGDVRTSAFEGVRSLGKFFYRATKIE
jgi:hypothetical protein